MALADLDELLVRATFSSMPLAASISSVSLEVAQPGPSEGPRALEVEECRCPPGYVGLSCQVSVANPRCLRFSPAGSASWPTGVSAACDNCHNGHVLGGVLFIPPDTPEGCGITPFEQILFK